MASFAVAAGRPDITLTARRGTLDSSPPGTLEFEAGGLWRLYRSQDRPTFRFFVPDHGATPVQEARFSADFSRGEVVFEERLFPPGSAVAPFGHPLDELLVATYLAGRGGVLVHACGLHHPEVGGLLLCGFSGAGKTTTARLWERRGGVTILSDDRIVLRTGDGPVRMYGTPWHGEARLSSASDCELAAILVLAHGETNRLTPLAPGEAVAALVARGFPPYSSSESLAAVLATLAAVVAATPCFGFEFTPDERSVEFLLRELAEPARG